jgi:hypothetical protein
MKLMCILLVWQMINDFSEARHGAIYRVENKDERTIFLHTLIDIYQLCMAFNTRMHLTLNWCTFHCRRS